MLSRLVSRLLMLASLAILVGVVYYFLDEYRRLDSREQIVRTLTEVAASEGPCAALERARSIELAPEVEPGLLLAPLRQSLVKQVAGPADARGARALLLADRDGLLDYGLCEQVRLASSLGEVHPVLALLRYTRAGGSPCDEEPGLAAVLDGLGSHRPVMLHALMADVQELRCLSPQVAGKVAALVLEGLNDAPRAMDDLDVMRVASFLTATAPLAAAQFGCRVEARGDLSLLGNTIGCAPDAKRRVLVHYRVGTASGAALGGSVVASAGDEGALPPPLAAGTEVLLLRELGATCEVEPATGAAALYTLPCGLLRLESDIIVAARIEALELGKAKADLLAGLATYVAADGRLLAATREPELRSWFAYGRNGEFLGAARHVELSDLAAAGGDAVPEQPLRSQCERSGAAYCYDVDWTHIVSRAEGEAVLFLSRPAPVLLKPTSEPTKYVTVFRDAFGREPEEGARWDAYELPKGGLLVTETVRDGFEVRWQTVGQSRWMAQAFGRREGGAAPSSARLLAVLDVQRNGMPELVVQRITREVSAAGVRDTGDEILILQAEAAGQPFVTLNRLTVHEY